MVSSRCAGYITLVRFADPGAIGLRERQGSPGEEEVDDDDDEYEKGGERSGRSPSPATAKSIEHAHMRSPRRDRIAYSSERFIARACLIVDRVFYLARVSGQSRPSR